MREGASQPARSPVPGEKVAKVAKVAKVRMNTYAARCAGVAERAAKPTAEWVLAAEVSAATVAPKKVKKKSKASKVKCPYPASLNCCRAFLGLPLVLELLEHQVSSEIIRVLIVGLLDPVLGLGAYLSLCHNLRSKK